MVAFLRRLIILVSIGSLAYSIYKYIENPSGLFYVIGAISTLLMAIASYLEYKSKKDHSGISTGDNSSVVNISGNKNKASIKK